MNLFRTAVDSCTGSTAERMKVIFIVPFSPWHLRCVLCPHLSPGLLVTKKESCQWMANIRPIPWGHGVRTDPFLS